MGQSFQHLRSIVPANRMTAASIAAIAAACVSVGLAQDRYDPHAGLTMVSVFFPGPSIAVPTGRSDDLIGLDEIPLRDERVYGLQPQTLAAAQAALRAREERLPQNWSEVKLSSVLDRDDPLEQELIAYAVPIGGALTAPIGAPSRVMTGGAAAGATLAAAGPDADIDADIDAPSEADDAKARDDMSLYAAMINPGPIRRQSSILDGNERQYAKALDVGSTPTTKPKLDVNDLFIHPPKADDDALSLRDVIVYTLKNNPDIGIARWQSEDTRHAVRGAQAPFLPSVDLTAATGIENTAVDQAGGTYGLNRREASIQLSQRLYDFGRSSQLLKRARALFQSRELAFRDVVEETVLLAVTGYLDLLGATELLENSRQNVREHEAIFRLVEISYKGGNLSEAELKRARTRLDRARTTMLDFENARENAINNFRNITGLEPGKLATPAVDVSSALALGPETIDEILAKHYAIQSFVRDGNSIKHQITAARRSNLPEFSLRLTGRYQDNVLGNTAYTAEGRALVSAQWRLFDGGAARSRTSQLRARERENEQRIVKLRNDLRQEASNVMSVLRTTRDKQAIFAEQVDSSERVVELYSKQFEAGRRTLLELLDAQADRSEAREESITNKYENLAASFASMRIQNSLTNTLADQLDFPTPQAD